MDKTITSYHIFSWFETGILLDYFKETTSLSLLYLDNLGGTQRKRKQPSNLAFQSGRAANRKTLWLRGFGIVGDRPRTVYG